MLDRLKFLKSTSSSGIILAIIGIILFSSKAVFVKYAYAHYEVPPLALLGIRMLFALPVFLFFLWRSKPARPETIKSRDIFIVLSLGCVGYYLASLCDFIGLQYIKASLERIILFTYPTFVLLINWLILKIPITIKQWIAIGITYIGVVITFWIDLDLEGQEVLLGGSFIMVSAITYAIFISGSGWFIPKFGTQRFTSLTMSAAAIAVFIHYIIEYQGQVFIYEPGVYLIGFLLAVIATVIPSFLISASIVRIGSSRFSIIAGLGPFSTIILATIFLNERLTMIQVVGTILVIFGIIMSTERNQKSSSAQAVDNPS